MRFSVITSAVVVVAIVDGHGLVTRITGANGVVMPGLTVIQGTPRDCQSPDCGAQADTALFKKDELASGKASPLGRTNRGGPVYADSMVINFMGGLGPAAAKGAAPATKPAGNAATSGNQVAKRSPAINIGDLLQGLTGLIGLLRPGNGNNGAGNNGAGNNGAGNNGAGNNGAGNNGAGNNGAGNNGAGNNGAAPVLPIPIQPIPVVPQPVVPQPVVPGQGFNGLAKRAPAINIGDLLQGIVGLVGALRPGNGNAGNGNAGNGNAGNGNAGNGNAGNGNAGNGNAGNGNNGAAPPLPIPIQPVPIQPNPQPIPVVPQPITPNPGQPGPIDQLPGGPSPPFPGPPFPQPPTGPIDQQPGSPIGQLPGGPNPPFPQPPTGPIGQQPGFPNDQFNGPIPQPPINGLARRDGDRPSQKSTTQQSTPAVIMPGMGAAKGFPTCSDSGAVSMTYHQVNGDGAGPLFALIDPTSGGRDMGAFVPATMILDVPGRGLGNSENVLTDYDISVQMPKDMVCSGTVAGFTGLCVVRVHNKATAGPFGGSAVFIQSPKAKKRAVEYQRLKKRHYARGIIRRDRETPVDADRLW
ncbi:hypothetical protein DRE_00861 [Drechslerella stenobrocha 248]|uniref:Cell surface protein n=1 Tax=Drechslerella stenobrocha 248 TaxID=1043628 RepID=W7HZ56_9PEZI|nr:hypothetical protein DRE_00861 [Drechslerella stenobrocha 248]